MYLREMRDVAVKFKGMIASPRSGQTKRPYSRSWSHSARMK
jgi:hypothetical protein